MQPTTLYNYYQSQGQALPSVQQRAGSYAQYGGTGNYTGTADQNNFLLGKLQTPSSSANLAGGVSPSSLQNGNPLQLPPAPTPQNLSTELLAGAQSNANTAQTDVTNYENQGTQLQNDYKILTDQLTGQTADTQAAENAQGLPQLNTDLRDLQNLSKSQTARYLQGIQTAELNGGAAAVVNAKETYLNRQNAIDSILTNSLISAKQGDITNAQSQVDRAISLKYDPIKQQLENKIQFLNMNYQNLSRADQKLATAQGKVWDLKLKQIETAQQNAKDIQNIALEAAKNGAPNSILSQLGKATDIGVAINLAQGYMVNPLDNKLKESQLLTDRLQRANIQSEINNRNSSNSGSGLLSIAEAQSLGVPYGTTRAQAIGITPQKPATVAQETVAGYAARIEQSNPILNSLTPAIGKMNPILFGAQGSLPSFLQSSTYQQYDQAARNFINATLRRESGAVISPQEFSNAYQQYLPKPGDGSATLSQKKLIETSSLRPLRTLQGQHINQLVIC